MTDNMFERRLIDMNPRDRESILAAWAYGYELEIRHIHEEAGLDVWSSVEWKTVDSFRDLLKYDGVYRSPRFMHGPRSDRVLNDRKVILAGMRSTDRMTIGKGWLYNWEIYVYKYGWEKTTHKDPLVPALAYRFNAGVRCSIR